jgi:hypothetical protein
VYIQRAQPNTQFVLIDMPQPALTIQVSFSLKGLITKRAYAAAD